VLNTKLFRFQSPSSKHMSVRECWPHQVVVVVADVAEALDELGEHPVARHKVVHCLKGLGGTQLDAGGVTA